MPRRRRLTTGQGHKPDRLTSHPWPGPLSPGGGEGSYHTALPMCFLHPSCVSFTSPRLLRRPPCAHLMGGRARHAKIGLFAYHTGCSRTTRSSGAWTHNQRGAKRRGRGAGDHVQARALARVSRAFSLVTRARAGGFPWRPAPGLYCVAAGENLAQAWLRSETPAERAPAIAAGEAFPHPFRPGARSWVDCVKHQFAERPHSPQ